MNRRGLRPRWGVYATNVKDIIGLGIDLMSALGLTPDETKERLVGNSPCLGMFANKEEALALKKSMSKDDRNGSIEIKRVMVAKGVK